MLAFSPNKTFKNVLPPRVSKSIGLVLLLNVPWLKTTHDDTSRDKMSQNNMSQAHDVLLH